MRAIPESLDPAVVAEIDARLAGVEADHGVRIPWAIESGSRAWGFPSPDSDYDCRFIFVRSDAEYLSLWPVRDVIETPLDRVFDVNGWDLAKAVRLIVKGNATAAEWLRSPIVYSGDPGFRNRLLGFADEVAERSLIARHYLHMARQQQSGSPSLKRFFYVLRPVAALRWLADHPEASVPPMDLPTLLAESTVSSSVRDAASELIATKAVTRELGSGTPQDELLRFVADELERARVFEESRSTSDPEATRVRADEFFRAEIAVGTPVPPCDVPHDGPPFGSGSSSSSREGGCSEVVLRDGTAPMAFRALVPVRCGPGLGPQRRRGGVDGDLLVERRRHPSRPPRDVGDMVAPVRPDPSPHWHRSGVRCVGRPLATGTRSTKVASPGRGAGV